MGRDVVDIPLGSSPRRLRDEKQNFLSGRGLVLSHILCNDTRYVVSPQAGIRRLAHRRRPRVRCLSVGDSCAALFQSAGFGPLLEALRAVLISLLLFDSRVRSRAEDYFAPL